MIVVLYSTITVAGSSAPVALTATVSVLNGALS
jgi:hypothetical protein